MLNRFEVSVAREEVDGVDTLRYSFEKLLSQAVSKSCKYHNYIVVAITIGVVLLRYFTRSKYNTSGKPED